MKDREINWNGINFPFDDEVFAIGGSLWELLQQQEDESVKDYVIRVYETDCNRNVISQFHEWMKTTAGVCSWYPIHFAFGFARFMNKDDFIAALYGVMILSLNCGWDIANPDDKEWYRFKSVPKDRHPRWSGVHIPMDYDEFDKHVVPIWDMYRVRPYEYKEYRSLRIYETQQKEDPTGKFKSWLYKKTCIDTYYPTDVSISFAKYMEKYDFVALMYGVTILSTNSGWLSELGDCPSDWYRREFDCAVRRKENEEALARIRAERKSRE